MKKSLITLTVILATVALITVFCGSAMAKVTGACGGCHTMHNSQNGADMAAPGGPFSYLLINDCAGCHTGTNDGSNTIPFVMGTSEPTYGTNTLAGGNFWWCENASTNPDRKGHNVFTSNPDDDLTVAPGGEFAGCANDSCHNNLHLPYTGGGENDGKYGCNGCHIKPRHHADDSAGVVGETGGWYRFLAGHVGGGAVAGMGVEGVEDDDWQYTNTASDHNEYLGVDMNKTGTGHMGTTVHTTTAYCTGCHGNFHVQDTTVTGESPWIRHPSDAVLPAGVTEYAAYTVYDPLSPVARPSLDGTVDPDVHPGTDMVMCLSCHRPHGSPYDDLLRWDYADMVAGNNFGNTGCFACHTTKDDS